MGLPVPPKLTQAFVKGGYIPAALFWRPIEAERLEFCNPFHR